MARLYFSLRTGINPNGMRYDLPMLKRLFVALYDDFVIRERFQEMMGKDCIDDQDQFGTVGRDIGAFFFRTLRKDGLWPIRSCIDTYSEDDLFDVIELLYDYVSVGTEGWNHSYCSCGMHYTEFDKQAGQEEWQSKINEFLQDYGNGYELSNDGEIKRRPDDGFESLVSASLPHQDSTNITDRVRVAVQKYQRRSSTFADRRDAVRDLIDVLEFLRPQLKEVFMTKDESDLFQIANNFGIRHHNNKQKSNYDPNIWTSWMFYFYLATVHAALRLLERPTISNKK